MGHGEENTQTTVNAFVNAYTKMLVLDSYKTSPFSNKQYIPLMRLKQNVYECMCVRQERYKINGIIHVELC